MNITKNNFMLQKYTWYEKKVNSIKKLFLIKALKYFLILHIRKYNLNDNIYKKFVSRRTYKQIFFLFNILHNIIKNINSFLIISYLLIN